MKGQQTIRGRKIFLMYRAKMGFIVRETVLTAAKDYGEARGQALKLCKEYNAELAEVWIYEENYSEMRFEQVVGAYDMDKLYPTNRFDVK